MTRRLVWLLMTTLVVLSSSAAVGQTGSTASGHVRGKIVFSSAIDGDSEIFVINADGSGLRQITHNEAPDYEPSWSPDGKRIVYVRDWWKKKAPALKIVSASGGKPQTFYTYCDDLYEPDWSPDGNWIAYEEDEGEDGSNIVAHSVLGHRTRYIASTRENSSNGDVEWSPDGSSVAYVERYDYGDIYIKPFGPDYEEERHLRSTESYRGNSLAWSPDGESLLFSDLQEVRYPDLRLEKTGWDIYVMPIAGGDPVQLIGGPGAQKAGDWSPDGGAFVYLSNQNGSLDLFIASADGQTSWELTPLKGDERAPDWWGQP